MIVEIKNFGPIDYLEIDLDKDLHLIYGENAVGKSYATYLIYCLLKNVKNKNLRYRYYRFDEETKFNTFFKKQLKKLKESKEKKVNITTDIVNLMKSDLEDLFTKNFQNSLLNSFSSLKNLKNRFSNKNYEITLKLKDNVQVQFTSNKEGALKVDFLINFSTIEIIQKETKSTKFGLYQEKKKLYSKPTEEQLGREIDKTYTRFLNNILEQLDNNIKDIYYLPASRSGLYQALNSFTPIIAELTQNRFFIQNKSIELPSLPEPLSDYFIDLSTVNKKNSNKEFDKLILFIQKNILKGQVSYDDKKRQILFKPSNLKLELNLSESSSMVAEISPFVIYLKHILNNKYSSTRGRDSYYFEPYNPRKDKGKDILFIEEPEAHLHPEVQVLLMEVFAKLVMTNVKIFITSHSNYMFNKLNNIILQNEITVDKISVYHLIKTNSGTIQDKKMVVTNEGIMDENFQITSEKLYQERMETYDK